MKKRRAEAQITAFLREAEVRFSVKNRCRRHGLHVLFGLSAQGSRVIHDDPEAYANGDTGNGSEAA